MQAWASDALKPIDATKFKKGVAKKKTKAVPLALYRACEKGDLAAVKKALAADGVDVNEKGEEGQSPLYISIKNGYLDIARFMLSTEGVDKTQATDNGCTPLYIACSEGHLALRKKRGIYYSRRAGVRAFVFTHISGMLAGFFSGPYCC